MKKGICLKVSLAVLFGMAALTAAPAGTERFNPKPVSPRRIRTDNGVKLPIAKGGKALCEVVVPADNRVTAFAGEELAAFMSKIIGSQVPVVKQPSGKSVSFILGAPAARMAGADLKKIDRDGYFIRTSGKNGWIACVRRQER